MQRNYEKKLREDEKETNESLSHDSYCGLCRSIRRFNAQASQGFKYKLPVVGIVIGYVVAFGVFRKYC